ncbi:alpha/beta-hydrolase [Daedaleopsis nitida]|nr:alpha/beta-hydrolase [Daedaleopsis nitida]
MRDSRSSTLNVSTFPPPEPFDLPTCNPLPLLPLETPPAHNNPPALPSPPRQSLLDEWYTLSTHIVPAAYPRTTPFVPIPALPQWTPNKDEFKASVAQTVGALLATKEDQWRGKLDNLSRNRKPMWNCVNRYVRKGTNTRMGVTLFMSHANGFPKEIWEPGLERLFAEYESQGNYMIDEIWSWEAANHGDSALLNRDTLGGIYDWRDNSRDILHFLLHYLPVSASGESLPTHLPRVSDSEAESRKARGLASRTLVAVGHSFGGATVTRAAIDYPQLLKSLFMLDAMIRPMLHEGHTTTEGIKTLVRGAIQRRDGWPSRAEAHKAFATTPFFQAWDPKALAIYVECGLYDAADGQVRLKMPGVQEAACFSEEYATFETFELLAKLDESVETRWVIADKLKASEKDDRRMLAWRRPVNSSHVRLLDSGHLIVQEAPKEFARELHEFLGPRYGQQKALL